MISMRTAEAEALARAAESRGAEQDSGTASLGAEVCTATSEQAKSENYALMERVVERSNLRLAYQRVIENKGAAGVDEMPVSELKDWLAVHWPSVKKALLEGRYWPQPVRRVDLPKPTGGVRTLGEDTLRLRINAQKSAVARPWERKFLGFSVTAHRESRLRIALESVRRLTGRVRELLRAGRGRSLAHTIETLNPLLRGWINYFQLTQSKGVLEELDGWVRRRLRCLLWRQWKRPATRARHLRALGLDAARARYSNNHGPWWNAGACHLNQALPATYFTRMGLVSLVREHRRLQSVR
jgi:Group II intron, maturase-specific domain